MTRKEYSLPWFMPGQSRAAASHVRRERMFDCQNGQVRHCNGRTAWIAQLVRPFGS